jgi:hypothetical protein
LAEIAKPVLNLGIETQRFSLFVTDIMANLPPELEKCLPDIKLPILAFLAFQLPIAATVNPHMRPNKYISNMPPNSEKTTDILGLRPPPQRIIDALITLTKDPTIKSIQCPHESTAGQKRFPLITVTYWARISAIQKTQSQWQDAFNQLQAQIDNNPGSELLQNVFSRLAAMPWSGQLPPNVYGNTIPIHELSAILTTEWLSDNHELIMLDLLGEDLQSRGQNDILIENTAFFLLLSAAYSDRQDYGAKKHYSWLRERGDALARGEKSYLATIANKNDVHWVALVINFKDHQVFYGDPLGETMPLSMQRVIEWWVGYHTQSASPLLHGTLPICSQADSFSCGVLSWDALRSFLIMEKPCLINPDDALDERLRIFLRLTGPLIYEKVSLYSRITMIDANLLFEMASHSLMKKFQNARAWKSLSSRLTIRLSRLTI